MMWISKKEYRYLQKLILGNSSLITSLVQELDEKNVINGGKVMMNHSLGVTKLTKELLK